MQLTSLQGGCRFASTLLSERQHVCEMGLRLANNNSRLVTRFPSSMCKIGIILINGT